MTEAEIIMKFRALDQRGQKTVIDVLEKEYYWTIKTRMEELNNGQEADKRGTSGSKRS